MTPDSSSPMDAEPVTDATVTQEPETLEATAVAAMADGAEAANQAGTEQAVDASRATSDALDAARERLNAMARSLPPAAVEATKPVGAAGEAFGAGLPASYAGVLEGLAEFNGKAIAAWRSNAESTIRHWQGLAGTRSLSEAIALSAEHARQQLEAVTLQTRDLSSLASRILRGAADPLKPSKD